MKPPADCRGAQKKNVMQSMTRTSQQVRQGVLERYFNGEDPDPKRDLLTVGSASLMMNDEETMEFIKAYGELIQKYMPNKAAEGRKVRKVTFVISPNEY